MNNKQTGRITCVVLLLGIIGMSVLWISHARYEQNLITNEKTIVNETKKVRHEREIHEQKVRSEADRIGMKSENPYVATVATNNYDYELANTLSRKFFGVFLTWDSGKSYRERGKLLEEIVSPKLLRNKEVFDDGKGATGDDYIENSGIQSEFNKSSASVIKDSHENIECLVKVNYESWSGEDPKSEATRYYKMTIDKKNALITSLTSMGNTLVNNQ